MAAIALSKYGKKATLSGLHFFSSAFLYWGKKVSTALQALPLELLFNVFKTCLVFDLLSVPVESCVVMFLFGVAVRFLLFDLFVSPMVLLSFG